MDKMESMNLMVGLNIHWERETREGDDMKRPKEIVFGEGRNVPSSLEKLHKSMNVDSSRKGLIAFFLEFFFHIQRMNYVLYNKGCNPQCDNGFLRVFVHLLPYNSIFICKDQPIQTLLKKRNLINFIANLLSSQVTTSNL
jgi:hypothetical protein